MITGLEDFFDNWIVINTRKDPLELFPSSLDGLKPPARTP